MNKEIIKPKNHNSYNDLKKRVENLEGSIKLLIDTLGGGKQSLHYSEGLEKMLPDIMKNRDSGSGNKTVTITQNTPQISKNTRKNNMLFSGGQIIAELANAIIKAERRK